MNFPKINEHLDHYRIHSLFSEGSHGPIFLAEDLKHSRNVTLSFFGPVENKSNQLFFSRLEQVAERLTSLNHPNIANILGFGYYGDSGYFVMEPLQGSSLKNIIEKKEFSFQDSLQALPQILNGLAAAHDQGIIHGGIKPSSIFVDEHQNIKIIEFGVALLTRASNDKLNQSDSLQNRSSYKAPEILKGHNPSPWSDIYSTGAVFFELLTGTPLLTEENKSATIKQLSLDKRCLQLEAESIDAQPLQSLHSLILKMLAKDYGNRYQKVADIFSDLTEIVVRTNLDLSKTQSSPLTNSLASEREKSASFSGTQSEEPIPYPLYTPNFFKKAFLFLGFFFLLGTAFLKLGDSTPAVNNSFTLNIFDKYKTSTTNRELSSLQSANRETPKVGSQFKFRHVRTQELRNLNVFQHEVIVEIQRVAEDTITLNIKNLGDDHSSLAMWSANVTAPPLRTNKGNRGSEIVILPKGHDSIYPLNIGRKTSFRYEIKVSDGTIKREERHCEVTKYEKETVAGVEQNIFIIECQIMGDGSTKKEIIHYSPELKLAVRRTTRWKEKSIAYKELWELIE